MSFLDKVRAKGEQKLNDITHELFSNDRLMGAVETILNTRGFLERKIKVVLNSMSVASRIDIDEIEKKIAELERKSKQSVKRLEHLQKKLKVTNQTLDSLAERLENQVTEEISDSESGEETSSGETDDKSAVCPVCQTTFRKKVHNQRYCSPTCRSAA